MEITIHGQPTFQMGPVHLKICANDSRVCLFCM